MKRITLRGRYVKGVGDASHRMNQLANDFKQKIPRFEEFSRIGGTLNVELKVPYPKKTVRGDGIIRFEQDEISPGLRNKAKKLYRPEGFTFIPVYKIQGEEVFAYIYSPDGTANPDTVIEIMANFKITEKYGLKNGDDVSFETITNE